MGKLMRGTGMLVVIMMSVLELGYVVQSFRWTDFFSDALIFLVFILYILLAISSLISIGKFLSPIIGLAVILVRVSSIYTTLGFATFTNTFIQAFNLINPTAILSTMWVTELIIAGGFFIMLLGAIPGRTSV